MAAKTTTHAVETLDIPAPNGECAVRVTCLCGAHAEGANAAIIRESYAEMHALGAQTKNAYTHVHNLVGMAHGPLRFAPQVKANGPWAASSSRP